MPNRFITAILAAAALVTALGAAPARASDTDDLRRFLGSAAGLVLLGTVLEQAQERGQPFVRPGTETRHGGWSDRGWKDGHGRGARGAAPLPRACIVQITGNSSRFALPTHCLRRTYRDAARLPGTCHDVVNAPVFAKPIRAYKLACLRSKGFTVADR